MTDVSIEIAARDPDLTRFRDEWEDLYRRARPEPSTSFEWIDALTRSHLAQGDGFVLLRLSRGATAIGLVPLATRRFSVFGCPVVALAPLDERYNTHSDLLAPELSADTAAALCRALRQLPVKWDVFRMARVLDGHPLLRALEELDESPRAGRLARRVRSGPASYHLRLPSTFDAYLAGRSGKFRNHLKRIEKKIAALEPTVGEFSTREDVERGFGMLLEIERGSWKQTHGTAISAVAHQTRFYEDLCRGAAGAGRLHLQVLTLGGRPAAYNLGHLSDGRYAYLKTSYVEEFKASGAPTYLRAALVRTLVEHGVAELDFPAEPYEWERQWTEDVRWHKVLTLYAPTAAGRLLALADRLRHRRDAAPALEHVDPRALQPSALEAVH